MRVPARFDGAPDLIDPVLGFRQWRLADGRLWSVHVDEPWDDGVLRATCLARPDPGHDAPGGGCSCGIYAWYRRVPRLASVGTDDLVCGAVLLWGSVELHHDGMRAEHGEIAALAVPPEPTRKRRRLLEVAQRLGVLAVPYAAVPAVGRARGQPVPAALRPPARSGAAR